MNVGMLELVVECYIYSVIFFLICKLVRGGEKVVILVVVVGCCSKKWLIVRSV